MHMKVAFLERRRNRCGPNWFLVDAVLICLHFHTVVMFVCFFFRTIFLPPTGRGVSLSLGTLFCIAKFYSFFFLSLRWFGPPHSNLIRFPPWNDVSVTKTKKNGPKTRKKKERKTRDAVCLSSTPYWRISSESTSGAITVHHLDVAFRLHTHTHTRAPHTTKQSNNKKRKIENDNQNSGARWAQQRRLSTVERGLTGFCFTEFFLSPLLLLLLLLLLFGPASIAWREVDLFGRDQVALVTGVCCVSDPRRRIPGILRWILDILKEPFRSATLGLVRAWLEIFVGRSIETIVRKRESLESWTASLESLEPEEFEWNHYFEIPCNRNRKVS